MDSIDRPDLGFQLGEALPALVRDAGQCPFGDGVPAEMPHIVRRHFGRDEMLAL